MTECIYEWTTKQVKDYFLSVIDKGATQKELAKTIGISESSISRFVNGEIGPGEKILEFLCFGRVFKYRPTQNPLPHKISKAIPQSLLGTGGGNPLVDKPDEFY